MPGLTEADVLAQWSVDGGSVLVYGRAEIPCRLRARQSCRRTPRALQRVRPTDRAGLLSVREIFVTDDLRSYAYTAYYQISSLFESEAQP